MGTWLRRLYYVLRQSRHDAELLEETEVHRSFRQAHLEREGLTPSQANEASRQALGNVLLAREDAREVWCGSWQSWWQDFHAPDPQSDFSHLLNLVAEGHSQWIAVEQFSASVMSHCR